MYAVISPHKKGFFMLLITIDDLKDLAHDYYFLSHTTDPVCIQIPKNDKYLEVICISKFSYNKLIELASKCPFEKIDIPDDLSNCWGKLMLVNQSVNRRVRNAKVVESLFPEKTLMDTLPTSDQD